MIKKVITYTDYDGLERTETFYFNITKLELQRIEIDPETRLTTAIEKAEAMKSGKDLLALCEKVIKLSYGVKSEDGRHFTKNEHVLNDFLDSPAYETLFIELINDPDKFIAFMKGVMGVNDK